MSSTQLAHSRSIVQANSDTSIETKIRIQGKENARRCRFNTALAALDDLLTHLGVNDEHDRRQEEQHRTQDLGGWRAHAIVQVRVQLKVLGEIEDRTVLVAAPQPCSQSRRSCVCKTISRDGMKQ